MGELGTLVLILAVVLACWSPLWLRGKQFWALRARPKTFAIFSVTTIIALLLINFPRGWMLFFCPTEVITVPAGGCYAGIGIVMVLFYVPVSLIVALLLGFMISTQHTNLMVSQPSE